jgi:hypothetical protein
MVNRIVSALLLATLVVQGCASQVLSEHIQKGMLVKEEGTGVVAERSRKKKIELISPLSVRVYEEVEQQETTKRYYQKVRVRSKATPKEFPWWDVWTKLLLSTTIVPLFRPDYWIAGSYSGPNCRQEPEACTSRDVPSVLSRKHIVEDGTRTTLQRQQNVPQSDTVSLFINGFTKGELQISDDVAIVDLHAFPELAAQHKPLKLTFKYHEAYAYSVLPQAEVERIFEQSSPAGVHTE